MTNGTVDAKELLRLLTEQTKESNELQRETIRAIMTNSGELAQLKSIVQSGNGALVKVLVGLIIFLVIALAAMVGVKLATPGVTVNTEPVPEAHAAEIEVIEFETAPEP